MWWRCNKHTKQSSVGVSPRGKASGFDSDKNSNVQPLVRVWLPLPIIYFGGIEDVYKVIGTTKGDKDKYYLASIWENPSGIGFSKEVLKSFSFVNLSDAELFIKRNKKTLSGNPEGVKHLYAVDNNGCWIKICKLGKSK